MPQAIRSPKQYDVCIIGSGAGGGMAAYILTKGGLNCALLEAGPNLNPEKDFKMWTWPYELPHRGAGVGGTARENFSEFLAPNGAWSIDGEPYVSAPGSNFQWFRSRIVGGRTNHWGRIALRFAPIDFKSGTRDGLGDDWPITYDDLAPYYDKVESYIGVFGTKENVPSAPDGVFLPPPKPRCTELMVKKACDKLNIICIPARLAILTRSLNGRLPCHYCGQCSRGCVPASNFSSSQVLLPPALQTGKLTLITGAMAREILVNKDGKAEGVSYIDKATRSEKRVNARAVVLAASACESARLLLNSKSSAFPNGLANSSGTVGRYLTDSVGSECRGTITTAPAECTCTFPGGNSIARTISRAGTISKSVAATKCPASACLTGFAATKKATASSSSSAPARSMAPPSASPAAAKCSRIPTPTAKSIPKWWISGAFPCSVSISSGRITSSSRPRTCRRPSAPSSKPWAANTKPRLPSTANTRSASNPAGKLFTKSALRAWAPTRKLPFSTASARPTT